MRITRLSLLAAAAALAATCNLAAAQTANNRIDAAGEATHSDNYPNSNWSSLHNSKRKTPAQLEEENGNKAEPRHRGYEDMQRPYMNDRPYDPDRTAPAGEQVEPQVQPEEGR
ncbi:MAG: hypothetical protein JSR59_07505 [Proteobacteria bacterium]|nr:hypothetical protein [Pseudomonadota bacterium]